MRPAIRHGREIEAHLQANGVTLRQSYQRVGKWALITHQQQ